MTKTEEGGRKVLRRIESSLIGESAMILPLALIIPTGVLVFHLLGEWLTTSIREQVSPAHQTLTVWVVLSVFAVGVGVSGFYLWYSR